MWSHPWSHSLNTVKRLTGRLCTSSNVHMSYRLVSIALSIIGKVRILELYFWMHWKLVQCIRWTLKLRLSTAKFWELLLSTSNCNALDWRCEIDTLWMSNNVDEEGTLKHCASQIVHIGPQVCPWRMKQARSEIDPLNHAGPSLGDHVNTVYWLAWIRTSYIREDPESFLILESRMAKCCLLKLIVIVRKKHEGMQRDYHQTKSSCVEHVS